MNFIGKLLPVDGYEVILHDDLSMNYSISLTHLYQPLIGIYAVSLYQTLLHESELNHHSTQTHHTLMNYLNLPLIDIYQARLKLEGIGLLRTQKLETDKHTVYTYKLNSPFSPRQFFEDGMLSELLYHHIGKEKYLSLQKYFQLPSSESRGTDITASFDRVFQTFQPSSTPKPERVDMTRPEKTVNLDLDQVDYTWLAQMLTQRMIPVNQVLTAENKRLMTQLLHLYGLTNQDIEKAILWSLTDENTLHKEEFKNACHDLYLMKQPAHPIRLETKTTEKQPTENKKMTQATTKEEQLIQNLELISPKQLLEDMSSGNYASEQDLKLIREVMVNQGLPAPVMNVLIHYVLLQSNMRLSKSYIETIASHWSRAHLTTAREAMNFAKQEIAKSRNPKKRTTTRKSVSNSTEVVPEWFKNREKQEKKETKTNNPEIEKELKEMAAILERASKD